MILCDGAAKYCLEELYEPALVTGAIGSDGGWAQIRHLSRRLADSRLVRK